MSESSLEARCEAFQRLAERFECQMPTPLIAAHKISDDAFEQLKIATAIYMSRCISIDRLILDEAELLGNWLASQGQIKNVTPNGMIVPKRHLTLEYNQLVKAYMNVIDSMNIFDFISSWHIPLNLRYKSALPDEDNLKRHHPTEHIHSDSWAGESTESVTTMIHIFGDIQRNHVTFYHPPPEFKESWLGSRPSYLDGQNIAERYSSVDFVPSKGELIVADFSSLHATTRLPGAGPRISIDTTFALKKSHVEDDKEVIHPWREGERASSATLRKLGEEQLLVFPDENDQKVDSKGGFKHPTNLKIVPLLA
jgi:hypothetical protein